MKFLRSGGSSTGGLAGFSSYIYGIILGILTGMFRIFGANAEGGSYAIIIGNLLVPLIEKVTIPKAFGIRKKAKKEAMKA